MANLRPILLMGLLVLSYLLWVEWQKDYGQPANTPVNIGEQSTGFDTNAIPEPLGSAVSSGASAGDLPVQESVTTPGLNTVNGPRAVMTSEKELLTVTT